MIKKIKALLQNVRVILSRLFVSPLKTYYFTGRLFWNDYRQFMLYSSSVKMLDKECFIARIVMTYHVIEKGLTMPKKRLDFGHETVYDLMRQVDEYEKLFGRSEANVDYAAGVVKEYLALHERSNFPINQEDAFWKRVMNFCKSHADIPCSKQVSTTRDAFFKDINASFPVFAASRHTCRHYEGPLPLEIVESAVKLAMTAPSACNRQHARVHCVSNHQTRDVIFTLQNGNRGFAKDADKLLVVTSDLNDLRWHEERNDIYTNAGMFLMNLCYALHYHKVAHCVLNWSVSPEADRKLHDLLGIGMNERPVALVCCGPMPERVELAASPRKKFEDIFTNHE